MIYHAVLVPVDVIMFLGVDGSPTSIGGALRVHYSTHLQHIIKLERGKKKKFKQHFVDKVSANVGKRRAGVRI